MNLSILKVYNLRHAIQVALKDVSQNDGKISIVVPDKLTVTMEKELFSRLNIGSTFNIEVITLTRLSQKVLSELNIEYTPISKVGSSILLKKILTHERENLKIFNTPSFSYNYSEIIFDTITQFKSSQVSSNDMLKASVSSKHLSDKIHDLRLLSDLYDDAKAGMVDSTDRLNMLARNIKESEIIKNSLFYFVGFDDFTAQGYTVIEQLTRFSRGVKVCVYSKPNANSFVYLDEVYEKLKNMAYLLGFSLEVKSEEYEDGELHKFLVQNVFSVSDKHFEAKDSIKVFNGNGFHDEIEFVARDIREKILNGERYKSFGIACFNLESYKDDIKEILNKYEINYYIDLSTSIDNTIYFKFFINYLKLFSDNFKTENIIQFINSPFINIDKKNKIKLIKIIKKHNINNNLFNLKLDEELNDNLKIIKNILNKYKLNKINNINNIIEIFNNLKIELFMAEKLEEIINKMDDLYSKKILMQVVDAFENLLREVSKFYDELSLDDLIDILTCAGKDVKIMPIPQSLDCVQVLDANEIFTSFNNLYILNMNSSTAPKITQDVGLILDKDIAQLDFKNKLSPTIAHLNKMARFKLFNSAQMFNERLIITMSETNSAGYSEVTKNLLQLLTCDGKAFPITTKTNLTHKPLSQRDLIEFLAGYENNAEILSLYGVEKYKTIKNLDENSIKGMHFNEISCSALENYFLCPFAYFLNYGLRLKKEEKFEIEKVDIGNIMHYLADKYYELKTRRANIEIKAFVKNYIDDYMQKDFKLSQFMASSIYYNLIKEATRFIEHLEYLDKNCGFEPKFHEYDFGILKNRTIPLTNEVCLRGKIDRIDFCENYVRIVDYKTGNVDASFDDLFYGKKLQLFLYAYFAKKHFSKNLAGSFYMPIKNILNSTEIVKPYRLTGFLLNDESLTKAWDKNLVAGSKSDLMSVATSSKGELKSDGSVTKLVSENEFDDLLNYSIKLAGGAIDEIKSGNIEPSPIEFSSQQTSCGFCPYLSICRKNSMQINFRKKKSVDIKSFGGENA